MRNAQNYPGKCLLMCICCQIGTADANYDIGSSKLPSAFPSLLGSISISARKHMASIYRDKLFMGENMYLHQLKWIQNEFVVLWDVEDKRGWLVSGSKALLHIVRASLKRDKDNLKSAFVFKSSELEEPPRPYDQGYDVEVLVNPKNLKLRVCISGEEIWEENRVANDPVTTEATGATSVTVTSKTVEKKAVSPIDNSKEETRKDGTFHHPAEQFEHVQGVPGTENELENVEIQVGPETVTKSRTIYSSFQDRVQEICHILESVFDEEAYIRSQRDLNLTTYAGTRLEGWDFGELLGNHDSISRRAAALGGSSSAWINNIKEIGAITLFGRGFGEIIQPIGTNGRPFPVPKGEFYLTVCGDDLRRIGERHLQYPLFWLKRVDAIRDGAFIFGAESPKARGWSGMVAGEQ